MLVYFKVCVLQLDRACWFGPELIEKYGVDELAQLNVVRLVSI